MYKYGTGCGFNYGGYQVGYGYGNYQTQTCTSAAPWQGFGGGCSLILVLFILLVIYGLCSGTC